jgi:hypothetical protein
MALFLWFKRMQDSVTVVGYPLGGDTISVTKGVVSRIEVLSLGSFGSLNMAFSMQSFPFFPAQQR